MSHKGLVLGTGVGLVTIIILLVFMATCASAPQAINPFAAITATVVAIVGMIWFKKISN